MASNITRQGSLNLNDFIFIQGANPTRADEYLVTFTAFNQPVQISLISSNNAAYDPIVQIIDARTNTVVAQDDDSGDGNNSLIANFLPQGGVIYKIRVTSFNTLNTQIENPYTLQVNSLVGDVVLEERLSTFGNDRSGQIVTFQGVLDNRDFTFPSPGTAAPSLADEYKLEVTAFNQPIQVSLTSSNTSVYDPFLQIINARTGSVVASDDDSGDGLNSLISNFLPQGGVDYRIRVSSFGSITLPQPNPSSYTLQVSTQIGEVTVTPRVPGIIPPADTSPLTLTGDTAQIAYVVYYGRPADNSGLNFWDNTLTNAGISYSPRQGDGLTGSEAVAYNQIVNDFGNSSESNNLFGGLSNRDKVNKVYNFAFNRNAEQGGLDFWTGQLDSGAVTLASFALEIGLGAQDEDIVILRNKLTSADLFTNSLDLPSEVQAYSGENAALFGRNWLGDFGTTVSTQGWVDAAITDLVAI
jgi:hypothetical protein